MVQPCEGNDRFAKRFYIIVCVGSHSVSRPGKRWIDTVKGCLRKKRFGCQGSKENVGLGGGSELPVG